MTTMRDRNTTPENVEDSISDDGSSSRPSNGQQPLQARKDWDVFTNNPPIIVTGSMAQHTCIDVSLQIIKVLAYICTFLFVLGGAVLSKGTLLFMTSQLDNTRSVETCDDAIDDVDRQDEVERVGWIWCLFFAYAIPEVLTFLQSTRICFFKNVPKPTILQFLVVATAEILRTIGTGLLVFMILPSLDVVQGAMLTNCLCFIPGCLLNVSAFLSLRDERDEKPGAEYYVRLVINVLALLAQVTGLLFWPVLYTDNKPIIWVLPLALLLISCGWWENFLSTTNKPVMKFLQDLKETRHYTFLYVSLMKIAFFFFTMLLVTYIQYDGNDSAVGNLFDMFHRSFAPRDIEFKNTSNTAGDSFADSNNPPLPAIPSYALWVLFIHAAGSYICYITGKFACRIMMQGTGFALPITITVPVVIPLLILFCGLREDDPCYFSDTIPDYLFFTLPTFPDLITEKHAWIWLLWLLSQTWITLHIWKPSIGRLMSTKVLFSLPGYESLFVDQSLAMNRRRDQGKELIIEDLDYVYEDNFVLDYQHDEETDHASGEVKDADHIRRVYACATMWHETPDEMRKMLNSIFRMDSDQAARRLAQKYLQVVDPDYYEFEAHIFFDDAFEFSEENGDEYIVNRFVRDLMDSIDPAASDVHNTECHIPPPVKIPTPYGGRLVWTLPGKTKMIAHLKNKDKIRHKKRWSQVMYMYYLLGHRLMELPISLSRKEVIARNTFILALDGDIDFRPEAMILLLDLMKKDEKLGAACGRIHPTGTGPMVWYQKFEYAIGHWMQKATEHVIGCVLCSPGCFSLFRGEALMDDAVMNKYATVSKKAREFVQYDQGEDRWLCTLLLQRGYRVEYSAASDAYTQSPEGFDEFYNQRRRWVPSTMANILDLLMDAKRTVKINNNISYLYIMYQMMLFGGSILGPGSIFLMLVGAFVAAFRIDNWTSFWFNIVPILIYMFICYFCKQKIQLIAAKIISTIYGLVMMAVLIGILLQMIEDGPLAPSSLFFFIVAGGIIVAGFLHPQEIGCLLSGVVYYVTIPSMYMLLIVYAIFNLHDVSWGTREVATKKTKLEIEKERKAAEEAKKEAQKKSFWGFLRRDQKNKDEEEGSFEFSFAGLCKCMLCTHPKGGEEKLHLVRIADSLEKLNKRMDNIERGADRAPQTQQRRRTTIKLSQQDLETVAEGEETDVDEIEDSSTDNDDIESKEVRDDLVSPYWIDHHPEMKKGMVDFLPTKEKEFWNDLIDKYLHVLIKDDKKEKADKKLLMDLRALAVLAFFMINALFVLVIFLLQLSRDVLHIRWPFGGRVDITFGDSQYEIFITQESLLLDPIGLVFILVFGGILIIQFIAMFFHRFSTLSHMLSTTTINLCQRGVQTNDNITDVKIAIQVTKQLQEIGGAEKLKEREMMEESVGRRKTVRNINNIHQSNQKKQAPHSLEKAFKRRLSTLGEDNEIHPEFYRRLTLRHRQTVNRMVNTARKSVIHERRMSRMSRIRRESSMGPADNM